MTESGFVAYGPSHWGALGVLAVGAVVLVAWGRSHRHSAVVVAVRRGLALAILAIVIPLQVNQLRPANWNLGSSLPLHLSDLSWAAAIVALWTLWRWAVALTYYWNLTLTPQALVTPTLYGPDFPSPDYLSYFGLHLLVVWAALYLTLGLGLGPGWCGYWVAVGTTIGWGLAMLTFNAVAGTNYVFVNQKPPGSTLLDLLGPWPWYLLVEIAIGMAGWALLTVPWTARRRNRGPL